MNAFICHVPLHYYLFASIYKNLENSVFLVPPMLDRTVSEEYGGGLSGKGQDIYIKDFLISKDVRVGDYGDVTKENFINYINDNIDTIICPHLFIGITEIFNKRIIKLVYGVPSDTRSLKGEYIYLMDLIVTFGKESAERISKKKIKAVPAGNPLFDDWHNDKVDEKQILYINNKLDSSKKTLLYLPTWGEDSSIDRFFGAVASLTDTYNVITKLHHGTFYGEANRLCKCLSYPEVIILADYFDVLPLYKVSDIVITDGISGATFDALSIDKSILTVGSSVKDYGMESTVNRKNSILEKIPFVDNPSNLRETLEKIAEISIVLDEETKKALFSCRDGKAGKRIAEIILDEEQYSASTMLEKYDRALEYISDSKVKGPIQGGKNQFLRRYYPGKTKKRNLLSRAFRRLLKGR